MSRDFQEYGHVEVAGEAILPLVRAITSDALARSLLGKYGLDNVQAGRYYPLSSHLAMLDEIQRRMPTVLKLAGEFIATEAVFPPEIETFEDFLAAINTVYKLQHRGHAEGEIGGYQFTRESDRVFVMVDDIPYPCRFDEGMYLGFANRFGVKIKLEHLGDACRRKGDRRCAFRIELL